MTRILCQCVWYMLRLSLEAYALHLCNIMTLPPAYQMPQGTEDWGADGFSSANLALPRSLDPEML